MITNSYPEELLDFTDAVERASRRNVMAVFVMLQTGECHRHLTNRVMWTRKPRFILFVNLLLEAFRALRKIEEFEHGDTRAPSEGSR